MNYAILNLEKAKGTDSGMSAHIERTIAPHNADAERTHLNRELIPFLEGVANRTQAIQHRLETAGLTRKIGTNQVRAVRILLTGSPDAMKRIENEGRLDDWCADNLEWLRKTYGAKNLVSAVLHLDETTPHIHATITPIVTTERVKRKREEEVAKNYRKKKPAPRLCCDEVMARATMKGYQDSYAEAMAKYGLIRGVDGSKARHVSTSEYYRDLHQQSESLQLDVAELLKQQEAAQKQLAATKAEVSREKLKNSAAGVGSKLLDNASSLLGTPKVQRLEAENAELKAEVEQVKTESQQEIEALKHSHNVQTERLVTEQKHKMQALETERNELKELVHKICKMFPRVPEILRMESLCRAIGFAAEQIKRLLKMERITFSGVASNPETRHTYRVQNLPVQLTQSPTEPHKLHLTLGTQEQSEWFKEQQHRRMFPHLYRGDSKQGRRM